MFISKFPFFITLLTEVFIFPICEILNSKIQGKYITQKYEFFFIFTTYLSYLLSFIFFIIIKIRTSNKNIKIKAANLSISTEGELQNQDGLVNLEIKKEVKIKSIKSLIFIIVLTGLNMTYSHFNFESYHDRRTIGLSYKILMFFLLSHFILKYKFGKHQYLTIIINVVSLLIKYFVTMVVCDAVEWIGTHIWFYFVYSLSFCLFFTLGKYYMDNYYKTPYFILFIIGVIMVIILLFIGLIKYWTGNDSDIISGFRDNVNTTKNILLYIADVLTQFGSYLGLWITQYYFTPLHTIIAENINEILFYIVDFSHIY